MLRSLVSDRRGAGAVEYAVLVGLIALIVLAAAKLFGSTLRQKINGQTQTVDSKIPTGPS